MSRFMMQVYVKRSNLAVEIYQKAFGAELTASYPNDDGTYYAAELDIMGTVFTITEVSCGDYATNEDRIAGNTMQFSLQFGEEKTELLQQAYEMLRDGATIIHPLSPCEYSSMMADFIDQFGVRWCLFI